MVTTHALIQVLKRELKSRGLRIDKIFRIRGNSWKIFASASDGRQKIIFLRRSDLKTLASFKAVLRNQI